MAAEEQWDRGRVRSRSAKKPTQTMSGTVSGSSERCLASMYATHLAHKRGNGTKTDDDTQGSVYNAFYA